MDTVFALDPVLPVAVILIAFLLLAGFAVWQLVVSRGRVRRSWVLRLVMVSLLLVIALRPTLPSDGQGPTASGGLEVYFVIDTTSSIVAEDYDGERRRLDGVIDDVTGIVDELAGAHFSVVTFDAEAIRRVPLTTDGTAVASLVGTLTPEITYYSRGSSVDEPVELLTELLTTAATEHPERPRVLFYLGDGEQTATDVPGSFEAVAPLISGGGVLGYGTAEGGRMQQFDGYAADDTGVFYIQDFATGDDAVSIVDEGNLGAIADQLGVPYSHRTRPTSLATVLGGIEVGDVTIEDGTPDSPIEYYWLLAIPLGLLAMLEMAGIGGALLDLRPGRRR